MAGDRDPWRLRLCQGISCRAPVPRGLHHAAGADYRAVDPQLHRREGARSAEELLNHSRSEVSRNQLAHDLRGAAVDSQHARISIKTANFIFTHEAVAAKKLQALVDNPTMHFRDPKLRC